MASQAPGPGYVWIPDGSSGSDPSSGGGGYWAPNPYAPLNEQAAPAANMVGGANSAEAINANWQMSQPLQNQFAELLTNPVSGYSPVANYGAQLGRFQFSHTAPVPATAPVGWGRYPGTGGAPPPPKWLTNPTTPTLPTANPPGSYVNGPGAGGSTPPTTGGPPPGGTYNTTGQWNGRGLGPASYNAHQAMLASRRAPPAQPTTPNTAAINQSAVLSQLGYTNPNVWTSPTARTNYSGSQVQWSPGDFASPAAGTWQANYNALPPALRVAYTQALSGGTSGQLARQIYEREGASAADAANLVNSMNQGGVRYAVSNGQLVQYSKNGDGTWTTTSLANLLNPGAPTRVKGL